MAASTVRTLDDDFLPVVVVARFERQRHPALIVAQGGAVDGEQTKRATEAVGRIVTLRLSAPEFDRVAVEVGNQPFTVAGVGAGRNLVEQALEIELAGAGFVLGFGSTLHRCRLLLLSRRRLAGNDREDIAKNATGADFQ